MPFELEVENFIDRCGQTFTVTHDELTDATFELELVHVDRLPSPNTSNPQIRQHPFALAFAGPAEPMLPQALYNFSHPELGEGQLFLVPNGPQDGGQRYQVVVN